MFCSKDCRNQVYHCYYVKTPANMIVPTGDEVLTRDTLLAFFSRFFKEKDEFVKYAELFDDSKNYSKSIFDFDFSNPKDENYKINLLNCLLTLNHKKNETMLNAPTAKFLNHFEDILRINRISMVYQEHNSSDEHEHGYGVLLFASLLNHSCDHNVDVVVIDNKFAFVVRKPINANEQLFMTYG
jgi:SET domain